MCGGSMNVMQVIKKLSAEENVSTFQLSTFSVCLQNLAKIMITSIRNQHIPVANKFIIDTQLTSN